MASDIPYFGEPRSRWVCVSVLRPCGAHLEVMNRVPAIAHGWHTGLKLRGTWPVSRVSRTPACARRGVSASVGCLLLRALRGSSIRERRSTAERRHSNCRKSNGRRSVSEFALRVQLVPENRKDPAYYIADCDRDANQ